MNPRFWEGPARFLANYWWAILIVIILALVAYFTRSYWLPLLAAG